MQNKFQKHCKNAHVFLFYLFTYFLDNEFCPHNLHDLLSSCARDLVDNFSDIFKCLSPQNYPFSFVMLLLSSCVYVAFRFVYSADMVVGP